MFKGSVVEVTLSYDFRIMSNVFTYTFAMFVGLVVAILTYLLFRRRKFPIGPTFRPDPAPGDTSFFTPAKDGKYTTTEPSERVDIRFAKKGVGSESESPPITVVELIESACTQCPSSQLIAKEYPDARGTLVWRYWSRRQVLAQIRTVARGFVALGVEPFDSVCIMGFNAPEWLLADLGAIYAGALAVGMYSTNNRGQSEYILADCAAKVVVLENEKLLQPFLEMADGGGLAKVTTLVVWDGAFVVDSVQHAKVKILSWSQLLARGAESGEFDAEMARRHASMTPGHCCTLIYTSGTTGDPKGVMLSHDNLTFTCASILRSQQRQGVVFWGEGAPRQRVISYLPLSHIAAQVVDMYGGLTIARHGGDGTIFFARSDALKGSLITTLLDVQPTGFLGAPRVRPCTATCTWTANAGT